MLTLVIDSSTEICFLALIQGETLLEKRGYVHENQLAKNLLPEIDALLKRQSLLPSDLKRVGAGIGPGSYTGVRLSMAVAKGLSFALRIPFIGFSSLALFLPEEKVAALLLPTRFGKFYFVKFLQTEEKILLEEGKPLSTEEVKTLPFPLFSFPSELLKPFSYKPLCCNFLHLIKFLQKGYPLFDEKAAPLYFDCD